MKELSIEEKARAYDNVRDKIAIRFGSNVAKEIFSEYEESEDEKIRNQIIEHIKWSYDKQECAEEEMHRWISWLEKQGEQKPVIEMKSAEESLGISSDTYNKIVDDCIYGDDKPTWSEEDETVLNNLIWALKEDMVLAGDKDTYTSWLEGLKNKVNVCLVPQNTWKPSEEQMGVIEAVINNRSFQRRHLDSLYEQLKKLREE